MTTLEAVVKELKALPSKELEEAADYIHRLKEKKKSEAFKALEAAADAFTAEEVEALERAIEEGCERIDSREW